METESNWPFKFKFRDTKQLVDEVFVTSGIIKGEVSVISQAEGLG